MTDPATAQGKSGLPLIGWLFVFVPVVYALSVGPVLKLSNGASPYAIESFYAPLEYLYRNVPAVTAFYDWYFGLLGIK